MIGISIKEASRLREAWSEKGDPPCWHPSLEREYYEDDLYP